MKVYGPLEYMQLEAFNGTGAVTGPAISGRMFQDVSGPLAVPYFYDNTQWRQVALFNTPTLKTQNSGQAVTVNWATGLSQQVVLTGHAVISFSNPQPGQVHTLVVTQRELYNGAALLTPYRFTFNMIDQDPSRKPYQPQGVIQTGESKTFSWYYQAGIKAAYANIPASQNGALTALYSNSIASSVDISPDGSQFYGTPVLNTNIFGHGLLVDAGAQLMWGSPILLFDQVVGTSPALGSGYTPDGAAIFHAQVTSPFIVGYALAGAFTGAQYADPATLPAGAAQCLAVHPSSLAVVVGHTTTPFMTGYPLIASGYGTKYANPASLPPAQVNGVAFSYQGDYVATASQTTPFIKVYPFDPVTGYGAALASPGTPPAGGPAGGLGKTIAFRPQGDFIAMGMTTSPFLYVVPFNRATGAFGTPLTITSVPAASVNALAWTPDGQYLLIGMTTSPFFAVYDFSSNLINTTVTFDGANPGVKVNDIAMHPSGEFCLLAINVAPAYLMYPLPRKVRNYLRLS